MSHHSALYVRIPEGVPREQVFQRVRELLAETSRHDQQVRLYRVAPWVEVLSPHSEALWQTVNRVSQEGPCEAVALAVQPGADTLYYRRDVGGQLARELKYSREAGAARKGWLSTAGQPEPWEAEVFTDEVVPGPAPVWTRDARQGERRWEDVPPVSTARAFGIITRALGLPAGEGLSPGDGVQESVVIPAIRGGVEYKWTGAVPSGPPSRWFLLGAAAILVALLWVAARTVSRLLD